MRVFRFDADMAWPVGDYGSTFRLTRLLQSRAGEVRVAIAYLRPGDHIGRHPGRLPQLFCVLEGEGWVEGGDAARLPIIAGRAAYWLPGEEHAAGSERGLTALILQADALDDAALETLTPA